MFKQFICFCVALFAVVAFVSDVNGQLFRRHRCNPCRQAACQPCNNRCTVCCQHQCNVQFRDCACECQKQYDPNSQEYLACVMNCDMQYSRCISHCGCGCNCGCGMPPCDSMAQDSDPDCQSAYSTCLNAATGCGAVNSDARRSYCQCVLKRCENPTNPPKPCECLEAN